MTGFLCFKCSKLFNNILRLKLKEGYYVLFCDNCYISQLALIKSKTDVELEVDRVFLN